MSNSSGFQIGGDASVHYQAQVERFMAPFVSHLVAAAVEPDDAVLDVACGTGFAAREASRAAGPRGEVVGCDINPGMIATARSIAPGEGAPISWQEASALDMPFADEMFDCVISQQGVQFFPDIGAGLNEMARVVRPEGRVAVTAWAAIEQSPFFEAEFGALSEECGADPAAWSQSFVSGGPGEVTRWFDQAELGNVEVETTTAMVTLPPVAEYVPEHVKALPWAGRFFELNAAGRSRVLTLIDGRLAPFRTPDGVTVPFVSYLATARRDGGTGSRRVR